MGNSYSDFNVCFIVILFVLYAHEDEIVCVSILILLDLFFHGSGDKALVLVLNHGSASIG
jgi:hypothetical protein